MDFFELFAKFVVVFVEHISAYCGMLSFLFRAGTLRVGGHTSWQINFFEFLHFFWFHKNLVYNYSQYFDIVFDKGLGGNTDRINLVLYLCFIVFIF